MNKDAVSCLVFGGQTRPALATEAALTSLAAAALLNLREHQKGLSHIASGSSRKGERQRPRLW